MKTILMAILAFSIQSNAATVCKSLVSEVLSENGFGTFDKPQINKSQTEYQYIFGSDIGLTNKDKFRLRVPKNDPAGAMVVIESRNNFGSTETRQIKLTDDCKIKSITHEDNQGNKMVVTSDYCNDYQRDKFLLKDHAETKSTATFSSADVPKCYKRSAKNEICRDYEGKFVGSQFKRLNPDSLGRCTSPYIANKGVCVPPPCPFPQTLVEDENGPRCIIAPKVEKTSNPVVDTKI